eukprot:7381494-Prymnesium_polylepis.1
MPPLAESSRWRRRLVRKGHCCRLGPRALPSLGPSVPRRLGPPQPPRRRSQRQPSDHRFRPLDRGTHRMNLWFVGVFKQQARGPLISWLISQSVNP